MPDTDCRSFSALWDQILAVAARQVPPDAFEVWLRPSYLAACDESTCQVIVPNEYFRTMWLGRFRDLLQAAIQEVLGAERRLCVSVPPAPPATNAAPPLPVVRASALQAASPGDQWLIQDLWTAEAVGIIGGPPKACKSWLALDLAVSVASGSPCLGVFPVRATGPVLLYAGEDSASSLRFRLESIARARHLDFAHLEVGVITTASLRLDRPQDQERLQATVALHRPKLLVLDPLIRVHGADENASGPMAALLGFFRALQRQTAAAIALVHHARKTLSARTGYSLRGSSDFYAWTDCLLYLDRCRDRRSLLVEHRSAPGSGPFPIELVTPSAPDWGPYLRLRQTENLDTAPSPQHDPLDRQILDLLASSQPLAAHAIRLRLRARKQRVLAALRNLSGEGGQILRVPQGYLLKSQS